MENIQVFLGVLFGAIAAFGAGLLWVNKHFIYKKNHEYIISEKEKDHQHVLDMKDERLDARNNIIKEKDKEINILRNEIKSCQNRIIELVEKTYTAVMNGKK